MIFQSLFDAKSSRNSDHHCGYIDVKCSQLKMCALIFFFLNQDVEIILISCVF